MKPFELLEPKRAFRDDAHKGLRKAIPRLQVQTPAMQRQILFPPVLLPSLARVLRSASE